MRSKCSSSLVAIPTSSLPRILVFSRPRISAALVSTCQREDMLILFILMDYPIHIATISLELSILYFKGLPVKLSIKQCISVHEDCFYKQTVQTLMKCRLMRHFIWVFTVLIPKA